MNNLKFFTVYLLLFFIPLNLFCKENKCKNYPAISIYNNVNIRTQPNMNAQIINQLMKSDEVIICDESKNTEINPYSDSSIKYPPKYPWYKIKSQKGDGWVFGSLLSENYIKSSDFNLIYWEYIIGGEGVITTKRIVEYNQQDKIEKFFDTGATSIGFSNTGKFAYIDAGSSCWRSIRIIELKSYKIIYKASYSCEYSLKWENNKLIFYEFITKMNKGSADAREVIFDNGKIIYTGVIKKLSAM